MQQMWWDNGDYDEVNKEMENFPEKLACSYIEAIWTTWKAFRGKGKSIPLNFLKILLEVMPSQPSFVAWLWPSQTEVFLVRTKRWS